MASLIQGISMTLRHVSTFAVAQAVLFAFASQACAGVNLIANGDFSSGDAGFTSDYHFVGQPAKPSSTYGTPPAYDSFNEFTYAIGANADLFHALWADVPAPGGSGDYMIVNGATTRPASGGDYAVWEQTVTITPGASYDFSAQIVSITPVSPARLDVFANGVQVGSTATVGALGVWGAFSAVISAGSATTIDLRIEDANLVAVGNDFGLADITLAAAVPETSTWAMMGLGFLALALSRPLLRRPGRRREA